MKHSPWQNGTKELLVYPQWLCLIVFLSKLISIQALQDLSKRRRDQLEVKEVLLEESPQCQPADERW